jgi:large subunit ribosomal protein L10e
MAALRKASAYTKRYARPYTRKSTVKSKSYIKTIPPQKIVKFHMGNIQKYNEGKLPFKLRVISNEKVQIRDNSIEAARQLINKHLDEEFPANYYLQIMVYPHHILRENKMLTGAGSDRMQTGMQLSFGKTIGRAALVEKGKEIFVAHVENQNAAQEARRILHLVKSKLPCATNIILEKEK